MKLFFLVLMLLLQIPTLLCQNNYLLPSREFFEQASADTLKPGTFKIYYPNGKLKSKGMTLPDYYTAQELYLDRKDSYYHKFVWEEFYENGKIKLRYFHPFKHYCVKCYYKIGYITKEEMKEFSGTLFPAYPVLQLFDEKGKIILSGGLMFIRNELTLINHWNEFDENGNISRQVLYGETENSWSMLNDSVSPYFTIPDYVEWNVKRNKNRVLDYKYTLPDASFINKSFNPVWQKTYYKNGRIKEFKSFVYLTVDHTTDYKIPIFVDDAHIRYGELRNALHDSSGNIQYALFNLSSSLINQSGDSMRDKLNDINYQLLFKPRKPEINKEESIERFRFDYDINYELLFNADTIVAFNLYYIRNDFEKTDTGSSVVCYKSAYGYHTVKNIIPCTKIKVDEALYKNLMNPMEFKQFKKALYEYYEDLYPLGARYIYSQKLKK